MSKVEEYNLVDITSGIHTGLNPRKNFKLNTLDAKFYYVTVKEIASNKVIFSENTDRINSDAWNVIQNRSHLSKGDILFSGIGTIGKVAYVNEDPKNWNCSESVYVIKPFNGLSGKYLYYVLQTNKIIKQYEANSAGSIMKGVRKANLEQLRIPLPHIKIQEEIVKILDSFTNLIDALNEELSLRQKQFEYYREKLLTFDDNVYTMSLGDCCVIKGRIGFRGYTIKDQVNKGEGAISLSPGNISEGIINYNQCTYISWDKYYESPEIMINNGDIIFCKTASVGKVAVINDLPCEATINPQLVVLKEININKKYLYYYLSSNSIQNKVKSLAGVGSVPNISQSILNDLDISVPSSQVMKSIVEKLDAFESLISSLKEEIALRQKQYEYYREKLLTFD